MATFQDRLLAAHAREDKRRADSGLPRLTKTEVWKAAGVSSSAAAHWYNGTNGADLNTCVRIALVLRCSARWLFDESGSMDGISNIEPGPPIRGLVPLISWVQAGAWCAIVDNFAPGDAEDWLPCPRNFGPYTFALRVRGVSMEPKYQDGDIIFVDPDADATHGKNVVVRLDDEHEATFKQLVVEGEQKMLRALNPDWPGPKLIPINGNATICGVVIGKWVPE